MTTESENHGTDLTTQKIKGIPLLTQPAEVFLNPRQQLDYAEERRDLIKWLLQLGKNPVRGEGYSVWLTREANPCGSSSLKYLLTRLVEEAGMDTSNRGFHWYMIRHSTSTYTTHDVSEKAAQAQLRHKSGNRLSSMIRSAGASA
jgi:hypothetical protein